MIKDSAAITMVALLLLSCVSQQSVRSDRSAVPRGEDLGRAAGDLALSKIYLAQTHVLPMGSEMLSLISNRDTLLKVDVLGKIEGQPPAGSVELQLGDRMETLALVSPRSLPINAPSEPSWNDAYTAILPREWILPGLKLKIIVASAITELQPKIGAPNPLALTLLRMQVFQQPKPALEPAGWEAEVAAKLPVSELNVNRKGPWLFSEVVVPPRADVKLPAVRVRSTDEYRQKTRLPFDGEQGLILGLTNALQVAAGDNRLSVYYSFASGVGVGGGLADSFTAMGVDGNYAVLLHEVGHTLSLPHWANNPSYPYQTDLEGLQGDPGHVGLTWGFDGRKGLQGEIPLPYFIPPTVQNNTIGRTPGTLKKDPMAGGGSGDQEKGFLFRMFSDFSVRKMQTWLEQELVLWDEAQKQYVKWDAQKLSYQPIKNDGVNLPQFRDAATYSILYSTSAVTPEANFIYTPIGPHASHRIRTFDPSRTEDLEAARQSYCLPSCDFTLRVRAGGRTKDYLVRGTWKPDADPLNVNSHFVGALNLPAADGAIQEVNLLLTPKVESVGLPPNPQLLARYLAPGTP
ncbi:MAG TPA: M66 family metalloprotease [Oligoflexus sp.]|uniref:M66 family metalloprotease n=1 Tax=Oligoflexus sp. TaxID=1971216 RepID=UPI002D7EECCD|nr:M66 family metalloprotease [Oligoflexus sp.]HET9239923.1 M66 family metalloprotease [Oligoflexus sp.]